MSTNNICFHREIKKQEAYGPQRSPEFKLIRSFTHHSLSACQVSRQWLKHFWDILLTRLKCWNFQRAISKQKKKKKKKNHFLEVNWVIYHFKGFYHIWVWQLFWLMDHHYLAIFRSPAPRRLHMKFEQCWPRGFRGEVIWNYQHFYHTNVWGPYKCIWKQTWPHCKKVKRQCTTIILATLVDLLFLMLCAKIQPKGILP